MYNVMSDIGLEELGLKTTSRISEVDIRNIIMEIELTQDWYVTDIIKHVMIRTKGQVFPGQLSKVIFEMINSSELSEYLIKGSKH